MHLNWFFDESYFERKIGERELFSAVWESDLKSGSARQSANLSETIRVTISTLEEMEVELGHPVDLPASQLLKLHDVARALADCIKALLKDMPRTKRGVTKRRGK